MKPSKAVIPLILINVCSARLIQPLYRTRQEAQQEFCVSVRVLSENSHIETALFF